MSTVASTKPADSRSSPNAARPILKTNVESKTTAPAPKPQRRVLTQTSPAAVSWTPQIPAANSLITGAAAIGRQNKSSFPQPPPSAFGSPSEESNLKTARPKQIKRRRNGGNGIMLIAIIHILLACGLIDVGIFMSGRFAHVARIWPDSYEKLTISDHHWFQNQIISISILYTPVTVGIGLMIFFPKLIFLLQVFLARVSFWRTVSVDGCIAAMAITYAVITGIHARILLGHIADLNIGDDNSFICYVTRGARKKAPQGFRDKCLLMALRMFGEHLSLLAVTSTLVAVVCIVNMGYTLLLQRKQQALFWFQPRALFPPVAP